MVVEVAREEDLAEVERLYTAACDAMRGTPWDIWWEMGTHPTREGLAAAVRAGELYVAREDASTASSRADSAGSSGAAAPILGAFVLNAEQESCYGDVTWPVDASEDAVRVIHLIATDPAARGRGVGRALVARAVDAARAAGAQAVRLDVFDNNAPAIALYRSCGFTDLGTAPRAYDEGFTHAAHLMEFDLRAGDAPTAPSRPSARVAPVTLTGSAVPSRPAASAGEC